ncbi:MAG: hypothetical protein KY475_02445 [Planctomycetes bacterium]|nr:hypothetical protein [Planctomycetota bacterium]
MRLVGFVLIVLSLTLSAAAEDGLRWKVEEGERLRVTASQASSTEAEIGGRTYESSLNVGVELNWQVRSVADDGTAAIEQRLSRLTMAAELPGSEPVRYDSSAQLREEPTAGVKAVAEEFRPLLGKATTLRLTPRGEILEDSPQPRTDRSDASLTVADVRQMLGRLLPPLPPDRIAAGEPWTDVQQTKTPHGGVRIEGRYTLRDAPQEGKPLEIIDATYTFHADSKAPGVALTLGEQNNTGTFYFDPRAGRLVRGEIRQSLKMQVRVEETQVEQRVSSTLRIEVSPGE